MNKSLFRFDRRRGLKIRKPRPVVKRGLTQSALYSKFCVRFLSQTSTRLTLALRNLGRWVSKKHHTYSAPSFFLKNTGCHLRRKLARKGHKSHKLLHWRQRVKRFKRLNYKLHRLRLRFAPNKSRSTRQKLVRLVKKESIRSKTGRTATLTNSKNSLFRSRGLTLTLANSSHSMNSHFRRNWAGFLVMLNGSAKRSYPKIFLTKQSRRRSRRVRRRRYRTLTQKKHTLLSLNVPLFGALMRKSNQINKRLFQSRCVKLPFSRRPQESSRWKLSYPYLFTNSIGPNKFLGHSLLQTQLAANLVPTRTKRSNRTKLNVHKKFSRLKPYKWVRLKSGRREGHIVSNLKLLNPPTLRRAHTLSSRLWENSLSLSPTRPWGTSKLNNYKSRLRVADTVMHRLSSYRAVSKLLIRHATGPFVRQASARPRKTVLNKTTTSVRRLNGRLVRQKLPLKSPSSWNYKLNLAWPNASVNSPRNTRNSATKPFGSEALEFKRTQQTRLRTRYRILKSPKRLGTSFTKVSIHNIPLTKVVSTIGAPGENPILPFLSFNNLPYSSPLFAPQSISSPELKTRTSQNFTLQSSLMFFTKLLLKNDKHPYTYKYSFKKKLFSFLYPNQVRNALLMRKKKIIFYKLVYKTRQLYKNRSFYWPRNLKKQFDRNSKLQLKNYPNTLFEGSDLLFDRMNKQSTNLPFTSFSQQWHEVSDEHQFSFRGTDNSFRTTEVRIPRIRFKPGYQRLWRQARTALQESLKLKFIYQKKLSRYVVRFFRQTNYYTFSRSEMSLEKTLMYSRLLPDLPTVNIFLDQNLVYLNGRPTTASKASVFQNDLLQLIVSKWYYIAYRWIANWTLKRHKKFKRLVYRKGLAGKHRVMKLRKQRSYYTPHWIYLARYDISDIKPYLEVDYLTLSVFVIYNPYLLYYYSPDDTPDLRSTIYRLYNWKYIT